MAGVLENVSQNGVQVVGGSNPTTPIPDSGWLANISRLVAIP